MLAKGLTGHKAQGLGIRPLLVHCNGEGELGWFFTVLTRLITRSTDTELGLGIIDPPSVSLFLVQFQHRFSTKRGGKNLLILKSTKERK